jgi:hypothetical protein
MKARRATLDRLVRRLKCPALLFSEAFDNAPRLLEACEERKLV